MNTGETTTIFLRVQDGHVLVSDGEYEHRFDRLAGGYGHEGPAPGLGTVVIAGNPMPLELTYEIATGRVTAIADAVMIEVEVSHA